MKILLSILYLSLVSAVLAGAQTRDTLRVDSTKVIQRSTDSSTAGSPAIRERTTETTVIHNEPPQYQADQSRDRAFAIENTFGLGPRVGWYKSNNAADGAFYFGLQARIRLGAVLGIEGAADYRGKEHYDYATGTPTSTGADVHYVPLSASALLFIPLGYNVAPYVLGGVAWYYTVIDYTVGATTASTTQNKFGYHIGAGLEIPVSEHASLSADYRWIFLNNDLGAINTGNVGTTLNPNNSNGYVISGALMFYF